jgi:hypothetical protein
MCDLRYKEQGTKSKDNAIYELLFIIICDFQRSMCDLRYKEQGTRSKDNTIYELLFAIFNAQCATCDIKNKEQKARIMRFMNYEFSTFN